MRFFSMFTGVGGFEIGIGGRGTCVGYSEIDKFACKVMREQYPEVHNYGNAKTINTEQLPDFDLLVGGFPCQAFSIAGGRKGFEDTRGTLFHEIARIARAKRPKYLLLENVKGLANHQGGKTLSVILSTFQELGYSLEWGVCNSRYFGVPQNRERIFIVGRLGGGSGRKVFPQLGTNSRDTAQDREKIAIGTLRTHKDGNGFREVKSGNSPTIPARAREDGSGQPVVMAHYGHKDKPPVEMERSPTLKAQSHGHEPMVKIPEATKKGYAEARPGDSINLSQINSKTRRGRVGKGVAQTVDTNMEQHTLQETKIRRLTPRECERLQGFPDDWTKYGREEDGTRVEISDTQRYKTMGNAVTTNVVQAITEVLLKERDEE